MRDARPCNRGEGVLNFEALCAGDCDEDRALCYCAGTRRYLPFQCSPAVHRSTRLPDGRPAYPARDGNSSWQMANVYFERNQGPMHGWRNPEGVPFEWLYGRTQRNPTSPRLRDKRGGGGREKEPLPFCTAPPGRRSRTGCADGPCPVGRQGEYCEEEAPTFCLRDCMGHGRCDAGFCWCDVGWFGIDCSQRASPPPPPQQRQRPPSPAASHTPLRIYVYDMPSAFTTRNLQWRGGESIGLSRSLSKRGRSRHAAGSLYAMEMALHEWLLASPLRTTDAAEAHLFYVPIYAASSFMWPIVKFADEPYLGRRQREPRQRSHQAALLMLEALNYIRGRFPFWRASGGRDHIWLMLHDEGPCFCPRDIRPSILLTHYGYWASPARPWGTFDDDNFLLDRRFYSRHLGDAARPTPCFDRDKDVVIAPWKRPGFWRDALGDPTLRSTAAAMPHRPDLGAAPARRPKLVFFAGDLGFNRLGGYSRDLRQRAHALFCDPTRTKKRDCTPVAYHKPCDCECRKDIPITCAKWAPGVTITTHSPRYHDSLKEHTFCLAFPGDGWSSRVLDAVTHGCIPVVVEDASAMFFEGAFGLAGLPLDYANFSVRLAEAELPQLVQRLRAIPPAAVAAMQRAVLWVRDYFVYKDMYNPNADDRAELLASGRRGQDAFLLLTKALEARARALGRLRSPPAAGGAPWWQS